MTAFTLPLVVELDDTDRIRQIRIALRVPGPVPWHQAEPVVRAAAGLADGAALHLGAGRVEPSWTVGAPPLLAGVTLSSRPPSGIPVASALTLAICAGPDAGGTVPLDLHGVRVGRASDNDLVVDDPAMSACHALVSASREGLRVTDVGSTNGVRIDGSLLDAGPGVRTRPSVRRVRSGARSPVPGGPTSEVPLGSLVRLGGSILRAGLMTEMPARTTPDGLGHLVVHGGVAERVTDPPDPDPPPPPPESARHPIPVLTGLISGALGAVLALILGSWIYLAVAAVGPLTVVATALGDRLTGGRRRRRMLRQHEAATAAWRAEVQATAAARTEAAWRRFPDPPTLLRRALEVRSGLWSRSRDDLDRLCLGVGVDTGQDGPGTRRRDSPGPGPAAVAETPVAVDLARIRVLGLVGEPASLLRWLLLQAVCLLAPGDLGLAVFSGRPEFAGCQDLPHAVGVTTRTARGGPSIRPSPGPPNDQRDLLVVVDDPPRWRTDATLSRLLRTAADGPGRAGRVVVAICAARRRDDLPAECSAVLELRSGTVHATGSPVPRDNVTARASPPRAVTFDQRSAQIPPGRVVVTGVSERRFRAAVAALTALVDGRDPARIPVEVAFSDLDGPVTALRLRRRWGSPSATARIGVSAVGPVEFDLDRHGPHLLVAGTTGAGKSELLRTLISGLAASAPPEVTSFLLIDYKGGAAFAALTDLPHVTGVVTDLDGALAGRALTSLRAELRRREHLSATAGPTPARLVIVVDEYAALAAEQPRFLSGLVDVAQRGRSLGLHLVLATQRPAGVVSPAIRANTTARICLRVTDPADSLDVVGSPAAAEIPAELPGRALLAAGHQVVPFQTARVSVVPAPGIAAWRRDDPDSVHLATSATDGPVADPSAADRQAAITELDQLVVACREAAIGLDRPVPPWLPPLPRRIEAGEAGAECLALIDRPDRQSREPLILTEGSVLVVGDPQSGRTTALARIAAGMPRGTRMVILDPRGDFTSRWRWPTADSALGVDDPALVGRVLELVSGPSPPGAPREPILLVIDGWEDVTAALDAVDHGATSMGFLRLLDSPPAGLRVAVSGHRSLAHHAAGQRIGQVIELGGDDDGEARIPGRGRYRGNEAQLVLPPEQPLVAAGPINSGRPDRIVVRPLPGLVPWLELPLSSPAAVSVGVGGDAATPLGIDLTGPGGAWVVAGPRRSGVSTALRTLAVAASAAGIPVHWVGTSPPGLAGASPDSRSSTAPPGGHILTAFGPPAPEHERNAGRPVDAGEPGCGPPAPERRSAVRWSADADELRTTLAAHRGPLLLVADAAVTGPEGPDVAHLGANDQAVHADQAAVAELLTRFCRVCGPGQSLVLGARSEVLASAFRGPLAEALTFRRAVLLGGDPADALRLGIRLPRRMGRPQPGRGFLVRDGMTLPIQVALPP